MKIFKRKENNAISVQTAVTKRITHPFIDIENYNPMSRFKFKLYSSLREAVPVIDASISKLVRLIGTFDIECDDEDVSFRINDFLENVIDFVQAKGAIFCPTSVCLTLEGAARFESLFAMKSLPWLLDKYIRKTAQKG